MNQLLTPTQFSTLLNTICETHTLTIHTQIWGDLPIKRVYAREDENMLEVTWEDHNFHAGATLVRYGTEKWAALVAQIPVMVEVGRLNCLLATMHQQGETSNRVADVRTGITRILRAGYHLTTIQLAGITALTLRIEGRNG